MSVGVATMPEKYDFLILKTKGGFALKCNTWVKEFKDVKELIKFLENELKKGT